MATIKTMFIDENYYTGADKWNTAFFEKFGGMNDQEKERYFYLASRRIKSIVNTEFLNLVDLEPFEQAGVKEATAIMVDYWMEYGLNLTRVSTSVSVGSHSASQTPPGHPDYTPRAVFESLAEVGLYAFKAILIDEEEETYPDQYEWNGLRYPFKFSYTVSDLGDLPTSNVKYRSYAYITTNGAWYAWDGSKWVSLGLFTQKGGQGPAGQPGAGLTPEQQTKLFNLPDDTKSQLAGKQNWMGLALTHNSTTNKKDVYKIEGNFSSNDVSGHRQLPESPHHLVDKQFVSDAINAIKGNGINIPHLELTTPASDSEIDTQLKALIASPVDGEVAYVGSNGNWVLWTYSSSSSQWSNSGKGSQHTTSALPAGYVEKEVTLNEPKTFRLTKDITADGHTLYGANGEPLIFDRKNLISFTINATISKLDGSDSYTGDIIGKVYNSGFDTSTSVKFYTPARPDAVPFIYLNDLNGQLKWDTNVGQGTVHSMEIHYITGVTETILVKSKPANLGGNP